MSATAAAFPDVLLALAVWRESRNQSLAARRGVKHVILNRAANPKPPYTGCHDVVSNILAPQQISSFNASDPNSRLMPNPKNAADWTAFLSCCDLVDAVDEDPTKGATHYFSIDINPPSWALPEKQTVQIGSFRFFKL